MMRNDIKEINNDNNTNTSSSNNSNSISNNNEDDSIFTIKLDKACKRFSN